MLKGFQSAVNLRKWDLGLRPTLLAVSGGLDSVVMARLFALAGFPFVMAHMNFGLRGRESAEDAQFVADLAQELGVDERTLRRERARGLLPFHQVGRSVRHTRADVEEYLKRTQRN